MDADEPDAAKLVALNGLARNAVVPLVEETIDVAAVIGSEVDQLVIEGTDVCTLVVEAVEFKVDEESLHQLVERQAT